MKQGLLTKYGPVFRSGKIFNYYLAFVLTEEQQQNGKYKKLCIFLLCFLFLSFNLRKYIFFYQLSFIRNIALGNILFNQEYKRGQAAQTHQQFCVLFCVQQKVCFGERFYNDSAHIFSTLTHTLSFILSQQGDLKSHSTDTIYVLYSVCSYLRLSVLNLRWMRNADCTLVYVLSYVQLKIA